MSFRSAPDRSLISTTPRAIDADVELLSFLLAWTQPPRGQYALDLTPPTQAWCDQLATADDAALLGLAAEALLLLRERAARA